MINLEKVIKDLEFENEDFLRQIKDEIELIDGIQKDTAEKAIENAKLEKKIEKANQETKSLHDQFKQNKEITESLKNATTLLHRYCGDLCNTVKLRVGETEMQRNEHDKIVDTYKEKWLRYELEYEKMPLAQTARKLKLEAANLDSEEKTLLQQKEKLQQLVKSYEHNKVAAKQQKEDAISCIVKLAQLKVTTNEVLSKISHIEKEEKEQKEKLHQPKKEYQELKLQLESQVNTSTCPNPLQQHQPQASQAPNFSFSFKQQISHVPKVKKNESRVSPKLQMPKVHTLRQFQLPKLPQLSMPKVPQMPKFPSFTPMLNSPTLRMNPQTTPKITNEEQQKQQQQQSTTSTNNEEPMNDCGSEEVYSIPLDQTNKEFFNEIAGKKLSARQGTPLRSEFSFSPGQHAEKLKLLKQSPANYSFRMERPMFENSNDQQGEMECSKSDEFTSSFSSQNQFMGGLQNENQNDNKIPTPIDSPMNEEKTPRKGILSDNTTFTIPKSSVEASPNTSFIFTKSSPASEFCFDSPTVSMKTPNENNSLFNFGSNEAASPCTDSSTFNFNTEISHQESPHSNSTFNLGGNNNNDDGDTSMFDFTIGNKVKESDSSSINMFNFGTTNDVTTSNDNQSGFLFNMAPNPASNHNEFSFTF